MLKTLLPEAKNDIKLQTLSTDSDSDIEIVGVEIPFNPAAGRRSASGPKALAIYECNRFVVKYCRSVQWDDKDIIND